MSAALHLEQSEQLGLFLDPPEPRPVIEQRRYSNGAMHFYEVDHRGKHRHIGYKEILAAYGHAGDTQGPPPVVAEGPTLFDMPDELQPDSDRDSDIVVRGETETGQSRTVYLGAIASQASEKTAQSEPMTEAGGLSEPTREERWRLSQLLGFVPNIRGEFVAEDGRQLTNREQTVILAHEQQILDGLQHRQPEPESQHDFSKPVREMDPPTRAAFFANFNRTDNQLEPVRQEKGPRHKSSSHVAPLIGGLALLGTSPAGRHMVNIRPEKTEVTRKEKERRRRGLVAAAAAGALVVGAVVGAWLLTDRDHDNNGGTGVPAQTQTTTPSSPTGPETKPGQNIPPKKQHPNGPATKAGEVAGFKVHTFVKKGAGITQKLDELAAHEGIGLSPRDDYAAYRYEASIYHGHFFTDDPTYVMANGDYGISRSGPATFRKPVLRSFRRWLEDNGKASR